MHSKKLTEMNNLQKKIMIVLLILILLAPVGLFLPMFFNAGDAWGEWSAITLKEFIGYVPAGLVKYTDIWKAPLKGYSINSNDTSMVHHSGYYILSGLIGAMLTMIVTMILSKFIIRDGK